MRKIMALTVVIGSAALCGCSAMQSEQHDQKLTLDQTPAPVRATIQQQAAGGTIGEIEMDTEGGKTIYSADVTINGKTYDVDVAADGRLIGKKLDTEDADRGRD